MKKTILLLSVLVLLSFSVSAQFELKGSVGTNFSSLSNPPSGFDVAGNAGYQFGAGLLIGKKFYIEPGIQFVRTSKTITSASTEVDFSQNFVKIPVYLGYHLLGAEDDPFALRVFAGPAVQIAGKIKKGEDQIQKDDLNNMVWMVDAGIGLDIFFLFAEVNYEWGLSKVYVDDTNESKHRGIVINAGVHFDF